MQSCRLPLLSEYTMNNRDIVTNLFEMITQFRAAVDAGFDSAQAEEFKAKLRESAPSPTPEEARALVPWVEALASDLRNIAER